MSDAPKRKLRMLKSTVRMMEQPKIRMLGDIAKRANATGRTADPRRTLPLNGAAWQKLRADVLRDSPLCEHCRRRGLVVSATDVDHVDRDPSNNSRTNLMSLCHRCHSLKTAAEQGKNVYMGCDIHGMPLDPRHPWNNEA